MAQIIHKIIFYWIEFKLFSFIMSFATQITQIHFLCLENENIDREYIDRLNKHCLQYVVIRWFTMVMINHVQKLYDTAPMLSSSMSIISFNNNSFDSFFIMCSSLLRKYFRVDLSILFSPIFEILNNWKYS